MNVDVETMRIVAELGPKIDTEICAVCRQPTLYILNDKKNNKPKNCGLLSCMRISRDPLIRNWP